MDNWLYNERFSKGLVIAGFSLIAVSAVMFFWQSSVDINKPLDSQLFEQYGTFIAGAVGSLWALAGVLLFYVALKDQRKDFETNRENLELQREELKHNTEELKAQREEFEKQNETLRLQHETLTHQQFENTFFQLLKMFDDVRKSATYKPYENKSYSGFTYYNLCKESLFEYYMEIENIISGRDNLYIEKLFNIQDARTILDVNNKSRAAYIYLTKQYHVQLDHYFRSLYHILKYVWLHELQEHGSNATRNRGDRHSYKTIEENIKREYKQYTEYIQAQMSNSELLLLYYNALFFPKMKKFVYHYDLIENLSREDLLDPENDIQFYSGDKFGSYEYDAIELKSSKNILKI